jgi:oxygen-independent coproporphyrinogen-3 oxidase
VSVGLYISIPFCRTKCSYCNFASDVSSRAVFERYITHVCSDLDHATETAEQMGGDIDPGVDSIYLGGGTPTLLDISQIQRLFVTIKQNFTLQPNPEITVECAPGTLTPAIIEALQSCGVNRVSLGVQSFVDIEAASVGRLHKRKTVLEDIAALRDAGITNLNVDLIAGLPHQTAESWDVSLTEAIASAAPHLSIYMLEVDEDSRLGRELLAGGTKYHAHFVPDEDLTADLYTTACQRLEAAGIPQYEISNFAHPGTESRHNLKYWTRQPYLGFGVDAHSMLPATPGSGIADGQLEAIRFSTPDSLPMYLSAAPMTRTAVTHQSALEETFFLGLRLSRGIDLQEVRARLGAEAVAHFSESITEFQNAGLLEQVGGLIRLTPRGRLLSNEVFEKFIANSVIPTGA